MTRQIHPPLAPGHIDVPHRLATLGDLVLEPGAAIRDYSQSYVTHGALNTDRSNAMLACSALTGTHHRLDFLIGEAWTAQSGSSSVALRDRDVGKRRPDASGR